MAKLAEWFNSLMWRWNYAGYVMRRTRCTFDVAMRQAREAQQVYDWREWYPPYCAAHRLAMWQTSE